MIFENHQVQKGNYLEIEENSNRLENLSESGDLKKGRKE